MPVPDLNIIVCTDDRKCMSAESDGLNGPALLRGLTSAVRDHGLDARVRVTPCNCIFGCTYGPRIDVARRWSGEKVLYGTTERDVTISVRGRVRMLKIPTALLSLALDNLPDEARHSSPRSE
jgi:hypothetical protein